MIDTHFHSVDPFATKMVVADGVITGMDLERIAVEWRPASTHAEG